MNIQASQIATNFKLELIGSDKNCLSVGSLKRGDDNSLFWAKNEKYLQEISFGTVICNDSHLKQITPKTNVCYLSTPSSPRLIFAKIIASLFQNQNDLNNKVHDFKSREDLIIGDYVFIGENVKIGKGTIIHPNVTIYSGSNIGENCVIHSGSSISTEGLGLELDPETNTHFKFPQIGGVILEDNVEIGPNSTIRKSALDNTIIGKGTKLGALCNIGHNCIIGEECILTCNIITSGSSIIGDHVFMGIGSTVKQGVNIGSNSTVGQGAVVVKSVPDGETWIGNPAKKLR